MRSFHHAFEGIIYATRTQPNMRVHFVIAALVLLATLILRLERYYVIATVVLVALVLSLELVNTAIESIVDLLTVAHHPLAKIAKDAAAGAVLIAAVGAALAGYSIFYQGHHQRRRARSSRRCRPVPANVALIALAVVAIATIFAKAWVGRGSALQGGAVSGHAALAFAVATMLAFFYQKPLAAISATSWRSWSPKAASRRGFTPLRGLLGSRPRHARRPGDLRAGAPSRYAIMAPI